MSQSTPADRILDPLNHSQREAVETIDGPLLILAGPGSGKTRVITHRIAWMIHEGIEASGIVALTFTNKAADEMRNRLDNLVPGAQVWAGTFHRFCSRLLRTYAPLAGLTPNFTIYDMDDSRKLLKQAIEATEVDLQHYAPNLVGNEISQAKNNGLLPDQFQARPGRYLDTLVATVYPVYQRLLQNANAVDFDDLLMLAGQLLTENPELRASLDQRYSRMMVDEYQDTNLAQYRLIRLLNHDVRNLAVTGDPDQSIYGWRGANIRNILEFERDYPEVRVVRLEQNYRSVHPILHAADQLISNNLRRKEKALLTNRVGGEPVSIVAYPNPQEEANDIAAAIALAIRRENRRPRDFAIFYRTNFLSRSLEHSLRSHGIPYQVVQGLEFYQRREIKDVIAWLHLVNNERDRVALERVINVPPRKIGKVTLDKLRDWSLAASGRSMLDACRMSGAVPGISKALAVRLSSFVALYDRICESAHDDVGTVIRAVLHDTRYREWLVEDGSEEGHERANNLDELVAAADEFDRQHPEDGGLETFLEQTALVGDTDAWESESDFVTLLTIHSAKGLEFPCVYIVGLEDGILPHERSQSDEDQIEEERRVLFVGITRAMERLQLSRCLSRFKNGGYWPTIASRFLMELPRESMKVIEPQAMETWGREIEPWDQDAVDPEPDYDAPTEPGGDGNGSGEGDQTGPWGSVQEARAGALPTDGRRNGGPRNGERPSSTGSPNGVSSSRGAQPSLANRDKPTLPSGLMTASQFQQQQSDSPRVPLDSFRAGGRVEHPDYGPGTIEEISGTGMKRTATVSFAPEYGSRRFRLSHSNLKLLDQSQ